MRGIMANAQPFQKSTVPVIRIALPGPRRFLAFDPAKAGNTISQRDLEKIIGAWRRGKAVRRAMEEKLVLFLNEPLQHGVDRWIRILNELAQADAPGQKGAEQKARVAKSVEGAILGYSQALLSGAQACCSMRTSGEDWKLLRQRHDAMMAHNGRLSLERDNISLRENLQATLDLIRSRGQ